MLHPIVAQMAPNPEQEPAIRERGRDVVVTAGAGTGKTRTLVARYLSLLAEGLPLRSLVAITFTRKAAREMRNRVRDAVRRYLERDDLSNGERDYWRTVYAGLDAARIGTIHSLCTEILRAHPAQARIDPRFEVLEEGRINILRGRAVDEALAWAADDERAVRWFELLDERGLRATLDTLMQKRLKARETFADQPQDLLGHWQQVLEQRQERALEALLSRPEWEEAESVLRRCAADEPDDRMEIQRRAALEALNGATGALAQRLESLARLDGINLGGGRQSAWPGGKAERDAVKDSLRTLRSLWRAHADLLELTLNPQDEALAEALPALRSIFDVARQRYAEFKHERDGLDFDDLEQGALTLLQRHPEVRAQWQEEVQAILVDEFQDTNARQRDLVALLNGDQGRSFVVGDAKQSIYRFRGADVTVFRAERERVERENGAAFSLATSYRAHRDLIGGLNDLLRPVLGEEADVHRPWAEPFAPLAHHRERPGPGFASPFVELHLTVGSKTGGALDRAADALAARIVDLVTGGVQVVEDGRARPLGYGDFAILCRASSSFPYYEDALERAGVPFLTVSGRGFYERPEVRDLLNALHALADPTDDLALVGLLRSPAIGLSDAAIYRLCQERDSREEPSFLWDILRTSSHKLAGADAPRAQRAKALIATLHRQAGRTAVADLLKAFLDATDYRAAIVKAKQDRGARNVSKLLADAHASGIVGVGEFLEYIDGLRGTGTREGEARATIEGAVQVMTVHQAKGLEFPVVIIGDITRSGGGRRSLLIERDLGVLVPIQDEEDTRPAIYQLGKERTDDQEEAESERLFYVAATRAREKLILSGCIGLKKDSTPSKIGGWLGKIAGPEVLGLAERSIPHQEDGAGVIELDLAVRDTPIACSIYEPGYTPHIHQPEDKAKVELAVDVPPPLLGPVAAGAEEIDRDTQEQERRPPRRVWRVVPRKGSDRAPSWVVGSLVHGALAAWRFPDQGFERWAEARARGYGLTNRRQVRNAIRRSRQLLLRFQAHSLFEEMSQAGRRLHEVAYSIEVDGRVESGVLDALYRYGDQWTIVEFKTDRIKSESDLQQVLEEKGYVLQARRYRAAAEKLLGRRARCQLCMLDYVGSVRIHPLR